MRALVLDRPAPIDTEPLRPEARAGLDPEPDGLVVEVSACAICRTDLQIVEGDVTARRLPIIPGHQVVGHVTKVGRDVTDRREGDRVGIAWLASACGVCDQCRNGRENLCRAARFTGWDRDGGYATEIAVRADYALRLPDDYDDISAAPLLCGGVIGFRALERSGITPGGRLGLFGFGASALLAMQVARSWGCEIHVRTRSTREQQRAADLGAVSVGTYDDRTPPLEAAVTFAPSGDVVLAALRSLDRGGTVAINAIHLDRIPEFPYEWLWWERSIRSVANFTRDDARRFLDAAASIGIETSIETFSLDDANVALRRLKEGSLEGTAVLVT